MNKLEINITRATIKSFTVSANEEGVPEVSVTLALLTEGGKMITTYSADTSSWRSDDDRLNVPIEAMHHIGSLARMLELAAVRQCRDGQLALPTPKDDSVGITPEEPVIVDTKDNPINLDDIPFADNGGLKWATPKGYQKVIEELERKDNRKYIPFKNMSFAFSNRDKKKLEEDLRYWGLI